MARKPERQRPTEARVIEIDTRRVLSRRQRHFGVIDIGSNSIRLVVYDDLSRAPFPRFNEKSFCALGAGLDETGRLREAAIAHAVDAIGRFAAIAPICGRLPRSRSPPQPNATMSRRSANGRTAMSARSSASGVCA